MIDLTFPLPEHFVIVQHDDGTVTAEPVWTDDIAGFVEPPWVHGQAYLHNDPELERAKRGHLAGAIW